MLSLLILLTCAAVTNSLVSSDAILVGNLKRREQIPLNQINRRYFNPNLNYRRSKEIRKLNSINQFEKPDERVVDRNPQFPRLDEMDQKKYQDWIHNLYEAIHNDRSSSHKH